MHRHSPRRLPTILTLLALAALAGCRAAPAPSPTAPADPQGGPACAVAPAPNSLWSLAQCCVRSLASDPGCRRYSKASGFIILKDNSPAKPRSYLLIPTTKVTGIEDPQIFRQPVADFWAYGWQAAQVYVERPAAETGLAINSVFGRTQNQLHIHISCLRRDVAAELAENAAKIGGNPSTPFAISLPPRNNLYRAIKVATLTAPSPFALVARMPGAGSDMAQQGIAVAGSRTQGVYFVLDTWHHGSDRGAPEELLDQSCRYPD